MSITSSEIVLSFQAEQKHIRRSNLRYQGISLLIHGAVFIALIVGFQVATTVMQEEDILDAMDIGDLIDIEPIAMISPPQVKPVYDDVGEIVIKVPLARPKQRSQSQILSGLISGLRGTRTQVRNYEQQDELSKALGRPALGVTAKALNLSGGGSRKKMWDKLRKARRGRRGAGQNVDTSKLSKVMGQHHTTFQQCYERALLIDKSLTVNTTLILALNAGGRFRRGQVKFKGPGSTASKNHLKSCLLKKMHTIRFPGELPKVNFKFSLLFRS